MSTNNFMSQEKMDRLALKTGEFGAPKFDLGGKKIAMSDGQGNRFYGDKVDFLGLQMRYPEKFSTASLSEATMVASPNSDSANSGMFGANISSDVSTFLADARKNVYFQFFAPLFGEEVARSVAGITYSPENLHREAIDLSGTLGFRPSVVGERPGEDKSAIYSPAQGRSWLNLAQSAAGLAYVDRYKDTPGGGMASSAWTKHSMTRTDTYYEEVAQTLARMGKIAEPELEAAMQDPEALKALVQRSEEDLILNEEDLNRFDPTAWDMLYYEATDERGLSGPAARMFVYEKAQANIIRDLSALLNGREGVQPEKIAIQMQELATAVGPDFIDEAMSRVLVTDESWKTTAWENLAEVDREILTSSGVTHEMLAESPNPYTYMVQAAVLAEKKAAEDTRELMFEEDYHDGWFDWTRRLSDTIKVDIANDPYAMYFLVGTLPAGLAAGTILSAGAAGATSVGRIAAFSAIDGIAAGLAEGYAASIAGQTSEVFAGRASELDMTGVYSNMAMYGAMGGVFGGALGGGIAGLGPTFRGGARITSGAHDYVRRTGAMGEAAQVRGMNRLAEQQATVAEVEGAQIFSNIENRGLAIRLNRGDVEAKEALAEVIPGIIHRQSDEHAETIEDLFSSASLAEKGMSAADAVDLVYGIQRKLGPNGQIGQDEFDIIVNAAMNEAKKFSGDGLGDAAARIKAMDASLAAKGVGEAKTFVGGSGRASLSPAEAKRLKDLTVKMSSGKTLTQADKQGLLSLSLRQNTEQAFTGVRRMINDRSGQFNDVELAKYNKTADRVLEGAKAAREDPRLQKAVRTETALGMLDNERAIRLASENGISATRLMKYIAQYKGIVGDADAIAKLDSDFPDAAKAMDSLAEGGGLEGFDAVESSFNIGRFLEKSEVMEDVRKFQKMRSQLRRKMNRIGSMELDEASFDKKLSETLVRRRASYRKLAQKLGINLDVDEAFDALVAQARADIPMGGMSSVMKSSTLAKAVDRLIIAQSPDALKVGERATDKWYLGNVFKDTSIGAKIERTIAAVSLWPIKQAKLFRSRNRIVRGVSNWITGQHVNNRVYSNTTDFMSIEAVVEGASRESLPYTHYTTGLRARIGGKENYSKFDTQFLLMRQMGQLQGDINPENISADLLQIFGGDMDAVIAELTNAQRLYTNVMQKSLDEMAEAGYPTNVSAARYIPNVIKGGLTQERLAKFVDSFVEVRKKQLLSADSHLDLDVLDAMGWIKLVKGGEKDAKGRTLVDKQYTVAEDSPFWQGTVDSSIDYAKKLIGEGFSSLDRVDPGVRTRTSAMSAGLLDRSPRQFAADVQKVATDVEAIRGNDPSFPLGLASEDAGTADGLARAISGHDKLTNDLRQARTALGELSDEGKAEYEALTGNTWASELERVDASLALRNRSQLYSIYNEFDNGRMAPVRVKMSDNEIRRASASAAEFSALSEGHRALQSKLDNLVAEGYLGEAEVRLIRHAFADMDPHKMLGITFTGLDANEASKAFGMARAREDGDGYVDGIGTIGLEKLDALRELDIDAVNVAAIMLHECAHLAFLSAPPRLQATIQSLLHHAKQGGSDIRQMFEAAGIPDIEYALSDVHEFTAALAEVSLVRSKFQEIDKGSLRAFLDIFQDMFKKFYGKIAKRKTGMDSVAEILGAEKADALDKAVKAFFDLSRDDTPADRVLKMWDLEEADVVDEFGQDNAFSKKSLEKEKEQAEQLLEIMKQGNLDVDDYVELTSLQAKAPDELSDDEISRLQALSEERGDNSTEVIKIEQQLDSIEEKIKMAEGEITLGDVLAPKPKSKPKPEPKAPAKPDGGLPSVNQAQESLVTRFLEGKKMNDKTSDELMAFTDAMMFKAFRDNEWPLDDAGKPLTENQIYDLILGVEGEKGSLLNAAKKSIRKDGPGGDRKGKTSIAAGVDPTESGATAAEETLDLSAAAADLDAIIETGLKSSKPAAKKAAKKLSTSRKLARIFQNRNLPLDPKGKGGYELTEEQANEIALEMGFVKKDGSPSPARIIRHNRKGGLLHPETLRGVQEEVSSVVSDENLAAANARLAKEATQAEARELRDIAAASPVVQDSVAEVSRGSVDTPPIVKYDNEPDTGFLGVPGYTRMSQAEFDKIVDESENAIELLARISEWDMPNSGEGVTYSREAAAYLYTRKAMQKAEAEPEAPAPKAADAGGEEPPAPPKAPAGAADDAPEPSPIIKDVEEYFVRKDTKVESGSFNKGHRMAKEGTLGELYARAVDGDMSVIDEGWKQGTRDLGLEVVPPLRRVGMNYVDHAGGGFKSTDMSTPGDMKKKIGVMGEISNFHNRTFNEADLDTEGGEELAQLFADAGSSVEGIMRYTDTHLASIRIQKALNELTGTQGTTMNDMLEQVELALTENLRVETNGRKRTLTSQDIDREIKQYMESLQELYLRARGFNPKRTTELGQASRIAQNIAYSILGAKFAMSVLFVEAPSAILRSSGLNPLKLIHNTGVIAGSMLEAARGASVQYGPTQKYMASMGLDKRIMKETIEDLSFSAQHLRSTSMAKFGAGGDAMEDGEILVTLKDRVMTHLGNINSARLGEGHSDPSFTTKLIDMTEAFTGGSADLTGLLSGMMPVTNAVRQVASNQGKATLLKHADKLIALASRMEGQEVTLKQIQGMAREMGIPRGLSTYAAESGLLRPGVMDEIMSVSGLSTSSPGRDLDLNKITEALEARRDGALGRVVSQDFSSVVADGQRLRDSVVPSLNQYLMFVTNELSPELRGTMRFQGMSPLTDLMFQMLSYPMAAYQALAANGVRARGPLMTAGILSGLTAFEFMNRNLQRALFSDDEEMRAQALENLTTLPDQQTVLEVLAMYGTSSPLFGAAGSYVSDIAGSSILRALGSDERKFPHKPFSSPAVSMIGRGYGALSRAVANTADYAATGEGGDRTVTSLGKLGKFAMEAFTPLNALPGQLALAPFGEGVKATAVGMQAGSGRNVPELSYPGISEKGLIDWMGSDQQPSDWTQVEPLKGLETSTAPQPAPEGNRPRGVGVKLSNSIRIPDRVPTTETEPQVEAKTSAAANPSKGRADKDSSPNLSPKDERKFQKFWREDSSVNAWRDQFVRQYGEEPILETPHYDYRAAWKAGDRPVKNPDHVENGEAMYHWSSVGKADTHPTAWKEDAWKATGENPDKSGMTKEQWESFKTSAAANPSKGLADRMN